VSRSPLRTACAGRIKFTPDESGLWVNFEAETRYSEIFAGVAVHLSAPDAMVAGAERVRPGVDLGTEGMTAEDTPEADFGRLLETVQKGWRPWRDSNPRSSP
jgi:hypothetical protein